MEDKEKATLGDTIRGTILGVVLAGTVVNGILSMMDTYNYYSKPEYDPSKPKPIEMRPRELPQLKHYKDIGDGKWVEVYLARV